MIYQDIDSPQTFYFNVQQASDDFMDELISWADTTKPAYKIYRKICYVWVRSEQIACDTEMLFDQPQDAVNFKLRFSHEQCKCH